VSAGGWDALSLVVSAACHAVGRRLGRLCAGVPTCRPACRASGDVPVYRGASGGVGACHAFVACACWVVGLTAQCTRRRGMAVPWEGAVGSGLVAAIDPCVSVDYRADVAYRVSLLITPIRVQRNDTRNRSAQ
jgi:hypothetical protein